MDPAEPDADWAGRSFLDLAAADVRGSLPGTPGLPPSDLVRRGLEAGLRA